MKHRILSFGSKFSAATALLGLAACGGGASGALSPTFPDNRADDLASVEARLAAAPAHPGTSVAVLTSARPAHLVAFDTASGTRLWEKQPADIRGAALVTPTLVITHEGDDVVGRALQTGDERFRLDTDQMSVIGADGDADSTAIALSTGGGIGARSRLLIVRGGSIAKDQIVDHALGVPAVQAGMVFLPWDNQNVSVLDAADAHEIARVRLTDEVVSAARASGSRMYIGGTSVLAFGAALSAGKREAAVHFTPSTGPLPGEPRFLPDSYRPPPPLGGAQHSVRLEWRPEPGTNAVALSDGNLYLVYYKTVFALDHGERKATWARLTDTDIVGAQAVPGGLLIGEQSGRVSLLDARTGETVWSKSVGRTAQAISFNAQTAMGSAGAAKAADGSTTDALAAVAQSLDVRLAPAQALAVDLLGGLSDEAVAGHLITLCENRRLPKGVRAQACKSLAERATGTDEIIFALTRHASFLEGSTAPPAGALGLAAAKAKLKDALPLLIAHLKDPHTPSDELPALMMALAQFKDRSAAAPIRDFVRMYHADDWEADLVKALVLGVDAMRALLGPAARDALEEFAANPLGMSEVRNEATKELAKLDTKSAATPSKNEGTAADNAEPSQGAPAPSQTR